MTAWPIAKALASGHNSRPFSEAAGLPPAVWWVFTPSASQSLTLDTLSTSATVPANADTILTVYTGADLTSAVQIAINDDAVVSPNFLLSRLTFAAVAGTTYRIKVQSFDDNGDGITTFDLNAPFTGTNTSSDDVVTVTPDEADQGFFTKRGRFW